MRGIGGVFIVDQKPPFRKSIGSILAGDGQFIVANESAMTTRRYADGRQSITTEATGNVYMQPHDVNQHRPTLLIAVVLK